MDLEIFGDVLPERHVYLATDGHQYSISDIKREFGNWDNYVLEYEKLVAAKKAVAKVVPNVTAKQTT